MGKIPKVADLWSVSQEMVEWCAAQCADDDQNSFKRLLIAAKEFKDAGLTPVFLCSESLKDLYVTTAESLKKKLN
jgi:hypothetical protein